MLEWSTTIVDLFVSLSAFFCFICLYFAALWFATYTFRFVMSSWYMDRSKIRSELNQCWLEKALWPSHGKCSVLVLDGTVTMTHMLSHPGDAQALEGGWECVTSRLATAHVHLPQHRVPDPAGTRSYQEPAVCFTEGIANQHITDSILSKKLDRDIRKSVRHPHGAWFSQWAETSKMSL